MLDTIRNALYVLRVMFSCYLGPPLGVMVLNEWAWTCGMEIFAAAYSKECEVGLGSTGVGASSREPFSLARCVRCVSCLILFLLCGTWPAYC